MAQQHRDREILEDVRAANTRLPTGDVRDRSPRGERKRLSQCGLEDSDPELLEGDRPFTRLMPEDGYEDAQGSSPRSAAATVDPTPPPHEQPRPSPATPTQQEGVFDLAALKAEIQASNDLLFTKFGSLVNNQLSSLQSNIDDRFDRHETDLSELRRRIDQLENRGRDTEVRFTKIDKTVEEASTKPSAPTVYDPSWQREVDCTILRLSTSAAAALDEVSELAKSIADEADLRPDMVKVEGQSPNRRWTLKFTGEPRIAAKRAAKFYSLSKRTATGWRSLQLAGADGAACSVNVDMDKNPMEQRRGWVARVAKRLICDRIADPVRNRDGIVEARNEPLLRILCESPDPSSTRIQWNQALADKLKINTAVLGDEILHRVCNPHDVQWSG